MIIFDASAVVSAALKVGSVPEQAFLRALNDDVVALSSDVYAEIADVLTRPRMVAKVPAARLARILASLRRGAAWFTPFVHVTDCRDEKDNKYLELAAASGAEIIVTGDADLLVFHPWRGVRIRRPAEYLAEAIQKRP